MRLFSDWLHKSKKHSPGLRADRRFKSAAPPGWSIAGVGDSIVCRDALELKLSDAVGSGVRRGHPAPYPVSPVLHRQALTTRIKLGEHNSDRYDLLLQGRD